MRERGDVRVDGMDIKIGLEVELVIGGDTGGTTVGTVDEGVMVAVGGIILYA